MKIMNPWTLQTCQAFKIQLQSKSASSPLSLLKKRLLLPSLRVRKTGTGKWFQTSLPGIPAVVTGQYGPRPWIQTRKRTISKTVTRRMFLKLESPNSPKFWGLTSHFLPAAMPMRMYCSCFLANTTSAQETWTPNSVTGLDSEKESTEELDPPNTPCLRVRSNTCQKGKILKIKPRTRTGLLSQFLSGYLEAISEGLLL